MLKTITFELETITPMFLAGADQSKAELRAASIKGLMRFWWRALQAETDMKMLRDKESKLFGSSDEGVGGSKFSIRVTQPDKQPLPEFKKEVPDINDPVRYLFYSTVMNKRPYFPVGSKFSIMLSSREISHLETAAASLWALIHLSGVGTRARRGAGKMTITAVNDTERMLTDMKLDFIVKGINSQEVAEWLINNFKLVKQQITDKTGFTSEYSNVSFSRFVISNSQFSSWKAALKEIGGIYKEFRREENIIDRAVLGLPLKTVTARAGSDNIERRSSPLIFNIIKAEGNYYWFILRLAGEFLPQGSVITAGRGASQKPDYGILDEFWNELKNNGTEHILSMPDTLGYIKDELVKQVAPQKIILFGSKARGDFHSRSDTDIAVETDKQLGKLSISGAIDIVDLKKVDEKLRAKINKEGVTIYERKS